MKSVNPEFKLLKVEEHHLVDIPTIRVDIVKNVGWGPNRWRRYLMAQTESRSKGVEKPSLPNLTPTGLAAMGEKRMEEFARAQAVIFSTLQETHRRWLDRIQSEARLTSEFTQKVTNARSIPDAVAVCREWTSRQFEMMADDGSHLLDDAQKVVETSARFLSNGSFVNDPGATSAEAAGDHQRMQAPDQAGPATAPRQHAAMRSDGLGEPRSSGGTASL